MKKPLLFGMAAATLVSLGAQANVIDGRIWENVTTVPPIIDLNGSLANAHILINGRGADVTFAVNSPINFDTRVGNGTIGNFLDSGGAIITGGIDPNPAGNSVQNTLFYFTGQVTVQQGQQFNVTHDDGLQLLIGNTMVVNAPGPTPPVVTPYTWNGPSGTYPFELAYAENSGLPGVLQIDLPLANVPDGGSSLAMVSGALGLLGLVARRRS